MTLSRFAKFAWAVVAWNMLVILWGALVSGTGSGAGCGEHWPLCQGAVVPRPEAWETVIEFSHRLTSGVALLVVFALGAWAWRTYPAGSPVRRAAMASVIFIILEALVGAALVLRGWVAFDTSLARVITQPIHLTNTLFLLAALTLTAWWASGGPVPQWGNTRLAQLWFGLGLLGMLVIGSSGALISLGDLLALSLGEQYNTVVETLVGLRFWHPAIAVGVGVYLWWLVVYHAALRPTPLAERLAWATAGLVLVQWAMGGLNVLLRVPLWTQLAHLFLADLTWMALLLWATAALAAPAVTAPTTTPATSTFGPSKSIG